MDNREFDPSQIRQYQETTVSLLTAQKEAISSQMDTLKAQADALKVAMAAAQVTAETLTKWVKINGVMEEVADAAGRAAAAAAAAAMQGQIDSINGQIESLQGELDALDSAITETNGFVENLLNSINNVDCNSAKAMEDLIKQIDQYKSRMQELYNRVGNQLVGLGYDADKINQQEKFANAVNDFGDSNIVNNVPFVPASYIYGNGTLRERILNGLFQKDILSEVQQKELFGVIDQIASINDLKSLSQFISAGYIFETNSYNSAGDLYYQYRLSETFKNLTSNYYSRAEFDIINSIINGKTINNMSDKQKLQLSIGALLTSFSSQLTDIKINSTRPNSTNNKLGLSINNANRKDYSGYEVSVKESSVMFGNSSWFVSEFIDNIGSRIDSFITAVLGKQKEDFKIDLANSAGNMVLSWLLGGIDLSDIKGLGQIDKVTDVIKFVFSENDRYNELSSQISTSELKTLFNNLRFGGILIQGKNDEIIMGNSILELNGMDGIGLTLSAYNEAHGLPQLDVKHYYEQLMMFGNAQFTPEQLTNTFSNLSSWIDALSNSGDDYRKNYENALGEIAMRHGISLGKDISYEDYQYIIETYPDEIAAWMNEK